VGVAISAGVIVYPYLLLGAISRFGSAEVALALLALAGISFALPGRRLLDALRSGAAPSVGIPVVLVVAAATEQPVYLQLVPCFVYLTLAYLFYASLRADDSIIERAARYLIPEAPEFIRSYCRKVTWLWVAFFFASSIAIATLAISGETGAWKRFTGQLVYISMLVISASEFIVRKTWFRYYFYRSPIDRLWEKWFPPENTPAGRRSMQYIASIRRMSQSSGD
jgi:uncharacterized membrane protein